MRKSWLVALLCLTFLVRISIAVAEPAAAVLSAPQTVPTNNVILQRVNVLLRELKSSRYSHKTEIDRATGTYNLDCSGLGRFILRETAPDALQVLPREKGFSIARAVAFYSGFTNTNSSEISSHWKRIERMSDVAPGDFIAWRKVEIKKGDNSGHVLIALEKPMREADGSFRVKLVDSSAGRHSDDSRGIGQSGVGTGAMWFNVDEEERPVAFLWTRSSKPKTCPISVGRVRDTVRDN